ncbi:MAG TPA: DUF6146 family protein [Aequorivita sp.]|nr:DUF6146 family protein [Aequorivita sp.]
MRTFLFLITISISVFFSCGPTQSTIGSDTKDLGVESDTIHIANEDLEYDIMIVEPGFNSWLISQPPRGFYGQSLLESKNRLFVSEYNNRVLQPAKYGMNLYNEQINYDPNVDYGYEVNYLLYNYFVYFQEKYNQHFIGGRN